MTRFAVGFSTSSPVSSVAFFDPAGSEVWSGERPSEMAASRACLELLEFGLSKTGLLLADATAYLADIGPGSFSGVRVGVMLAKTLAFAGGAPAAGIPAFDLIAADRPAYLPARKGEFLLRVPGAEPTRLPYPPAGAVGYGPGGGIYPSASGFSKVWGSIDLKPPELLVPGYVLEPSISVPKKPYGGIIG